MKILNLAYDDYSNFMYAQDRALKSVLGFENSQTYKLKPHAFNYQFEAKFIGEAEMISIIIHYNPDIIQIFHSSFKIYEIIHKAKYKGKITVWHTGTAYRENPKGISELFKNVDLQFTDQCEFLISNQNLIYVATAVHVKECIPLFQYKRPYTFAHYPSKRETKGSDFILERMARLCQWHEGKIRFDYSTNLVTHSEQMDRMNKCDIYIELFKPEINGKPYGCFGVTAFEAAGLGKIVITQNIYEKAYFDAYEVELPFMIANTEIEFEECVSRLAVMSAERVCSIQESTFKWVCENHSFEATGSRLKKILSAL